MSIVRLNQGAWQGNGGIDIRIDQGAWQGGENGVTIAHAVKSVTATRGTHTTAAGASYDHTAKSVTATRGTHTTAAGASYDHAVKSVTAAPGAHAYAAGASYDHAAKSATAIAGTHTATAGASYDHAATSATATAGTHTAAAGASYDHTATAIRATAGTHAVTLGAAYLHAVTSATATAGTHAYATGASYDHTATSATATAGAHSIDAGGGVIIAHTAGAVRATPGTHATTTGASHAHTTTTATATAGTHTVTLGAIYSHSAATVTATTGGHTTCTGAIYAHATTAITATRGTHVCVTGASYIHTSAAVRAVAGSHTLVVGKRFWWREFLSTKSNVEDLNMAKRNVSIVVSYRAWDTNTNAAKTGDAANQSVQISLDGAAGTAATNSPSEILDSLGAATGRYKITLTAAETNGNVVRVMPKSTTAYVSCEDVLIVMESIGGSRAITLTVNDATSGDPISDVSAKVMNSAQSATLWYGTTNTSGQVTGTLDDGSYKVRLRKSGVTFATAETLTVSGDTSATYTGTVAASAAVSADCQLLKMYLLGPNEAATAGMTVTATARDLNTHLSQKIYTSQVLTGTTDINGYTTLELAKGVKFLVEASYSGDLYLSKEITVTSDASKYLDTYL